MVSNVIKEFTQWLKLNTSLSESSIGKYTRSVNVISRDMMEINIIDKQLIDMNLFELDLAINKIFKNPQFILKDQVGRRMYSNSLKHYRYFISTIDEITYPLTNEHIFTVRETVVKTRIGQNTFRNELIHKYDGKCIVTRINHPKLLIASHIKPWSVCENSERIDVENGLLLSSNIDKLFDCGLITFNNDGRLAISNFVGKDNEKELHISKDIIVDLKASSKLLDYLDYHRSVLFIK